MKFLNQGIHQKHEVMSPHSILMLEHDEDDRYITATYLEEHHPEIKISFVNNSKELFSHLSQCIEKKQSYPSLILLNQHAVPDDAVEILKKLKSNLHYNHIPVVVLSGIKDANLIKKCYAAGASSFIQKPDDHTETSSKISIFIKYWFETVEFK